MKMEIRRTKVERPSHGNSGSVNYDFRHLKRKLPPAYLEILKTLKPRFHKVAQLSSQERMTATQRKELEGELMDIGLEGGSMLRSVHEGVNHIIPSNTLLHRQKMGLYWDLFGHPPTQDHEMGGRLIANCATNSILHTAMFSESGHGKVGVLKMPGHICPVIQIGGKKYVLDGDALFVRSERGERSPPTIKEYAKELASAHADPSNVLNVVAKSMIGRRHADASDFAAVMKYVGGEESALADAYNNFGKVLINAGDYDGAFAHLKRAIELDPRSWNAYKNLAGIHTLRGEYAEAERMIDHAFSLNPHDVELHNNRGILEYVRGNNREAEGWYKKALAIKPNHASSLVNLSNIRIDENRLDEAEGLVMQALESDPHNPKVHLTLERLNQYKNERH